MRSSPVGCLRNRVNNIRVGDLATFANGDLNFDGITNVTDMALFRDALGGPGSGGGLDLTAFNSLGSSGTILDCTGIDFVWLMGLLPPTRAQERVMAACD